MSLRDRLASLLPGGGKVRIEREAPAVPARATAPDPLPVNDLRERIVPCPKCRKSLGTVVQLTRELGDFFLTCSDCGQGVRLQVVDSGWMVSPASHHQVPRASGAG